jgi:uncharacterized protein (UPF0147 family)
MFENIIVMLKQIEEDKTVPRNIRLRIGECVKCLQSDKEAVAIRINTVTSCLDEVSNDPNIPMYTRTQIWNIASILEGMQKQG